MALRFHPADATQQAASRAKPKGARLASRMLRCTRVTKAAHPAPAKSTATTANGHAATAHTCSARFRLRRVFIASGPSRAPAGLRRSAKRGSALPLLALQLAMPHFAHQCRLGGRSFVPKTYMWRPTSRTLPHARLAHVPVFALAFISIGAPSVSPLAGKVGPAKHRAPGLATAGNRAPPVWRCSALSSIVARATTAAARRRHPKKLVPTRRGHPPLRARELPIGRGTPRGNRVNTNTKIPPVNKKLPPPNYRLVLNH